MLKNFRLQETRKLLQKSFVYGGTSQGVKNRLFLQASTTFF